MTESWILGYYPCPNCAHLKFSHRIEIDLIDIHLNWRILAMKIELICPRCEIIAHTLFDHISVN